MTVCFQYLVLQVTVSDDSTTFFCIGLLHSELDVATQILPLELGTESIKAGGEVTRQSELPHKTCVCLIDILCPAVCQREQQEQ